MPVHLCHTFVEIDTKSYHSCFFFSSPPATACSLFKSAAGFRQFQLPWCPVQLFRVMEITCHR